MWYQSPLPPANRAAATLLFSAGFGYSSLQVEGLRIHKNSMSDVLRDRDRKSMTFICIYITIMYTYCMICMYIPVAQDIIYKYHISMPTRAYQSINPSSKDGQDKHVGPGT